MSPDVEKRFLYKIKKTSTCWIWTSTTRGRPGNMYGCLWVNGGWKAAHRLSYEYHIDTIPSGLFVCHKCNNKICVNPKHLYVADHATNIAHAKRDGLMQNTKPFQTHCKRGHEFTTENTRLHRNKRWRICRKCVAMMGKLWRERNNA